MTEREGRDESRRDFVKKVAWVAPIVLSLAAKPAHADNGSGAAGCVPPPGGTVCG